MITPKVILRFLRKYGKDNFISNLDSHSKILDVGCGNASTIQNIKIIKPFCNLTGIDINDYNQTLDSKRVIDNYIIAHPNDFAKSIDSIPLQFDAVMSSHNLEHTLDREKVLISMLDKVKKNGVLYISFPCERSINFPRRAGTLNYYDDETHKENPPDFDGIIRTIKDNNFQIIYSSRRYRPLILFFIGLLLEPISSIKKRVLRGTWEFYGFESIIHARKM